MINEKDKGLLMILTAAGFIDAKQFKKAKTKIRKEVNKSNGQKPNHKGNQRATRKN